MTGHTLAGKVVVDESRNRAKFQLGCPVPGCPTKVRGSYEPAGGVWPLLEAWTRLHEATDDQTTTERTTDA